MNEKKTIIFEEKYNTNINDFETHVDIDEFIAKKLGKDISDSIGGKMKVTLSIRQYINWIWIIERNKDIRNEYKKLSDIPLEFLPKFVFVNENEFYEAVKICGSSCSEEGMDNLKKGKEIDIEWIDDFNYQEKLLSYQK